MGSLAPKIIFEDDNIRVINKPVGWVVHHENNIKNSSVESVSDWLGDIDGEAKNMYRSGIVHRLDKGTSGVLLAGKNEKWVEYLKELFKSRKISKTYLALVSGKLPKSGEINVPIERNKNKFGVWHVGIEGKVAKTRFEARDTKQKDGAYYSLVNFFPYTGRTHQIRVHSSYMGWPLVGDKPYGGRTEYLDHPFLHASSIEFDYYGKWTKFECNIPKELEEVLERYGF